MTLSLQDVYAANILDTVRQPLLLLSADLRRHGKPGPTPTLRALLEEILSARIELKDSELRQSLPGVVGASSFVTKPVTFEALVGVMKNIGQYGFEVVELPAP